MKKEYIKMNHSEDKLSLGNLFRVMKEKSKNKTSALQTEFFSILFDTDIMGTTTINNYCVGCRRIGDDYKQTFLNKQKKYEKENGIFIETIVQLLSIIDGKVYQAKEKKFINQNESMQNITNHMYNIAKNDSLVPSNLIQELNAFMNQKNYYEAFVEILFYVVLENKQPLYQSDIQKEKIENLLNDSCMSYKGLEEYLKLTFQENGNHDYRLKSLAKNGNVYANFELGSKEYTGVVKGFPRYIEAYEYLKVASDAGHAGASYMIGNMFLKGYIGEKEMQYKNAYIYFNKAVEKGSIAALNSLGMMYLNGFYVKKEKEKAIGYFKEAAAQDCVYAYNNLGKIMEKENKKEAFSYYLKSADLGESWACNKVGEWYRKDKKWKEAFHYYNKALESDYQHASYYAYYNLAIYFYKEGEIESNTKKNENTYKEYLNIAFNNGILEAGIELFYYFVELYYQTKDEFILRNIYTYKEKIEKHKSFKKEQKEQIEETLKKIKKNTLTIHFQK